MSEQNNNVEGIMEENEIVNPPYAFSSDKEEEQKAEMESKAKFWSEFSHKTDAEREALLEMRLPKENVFKPLKELASELLQAFGYNQMEDAKNIEDLPNESYVCFPNAEHGAEHSFRPHFAFRNDLGKLYTAQILTQGMGGTVAQKFTFHALEGRLNTTGIAFIVTHGKEFDTKYCNAIPNHIAKVMTIPSDNQAVVWCKPFEFLKSVLYILNESLMREAA